MNKFKVGDTVQVTDQFPHATGKVIESSTWGIINGHGQNDNPCYRVKCDTWASPNWIDENNLKEPTP